MFGCGGGQGRERLQDRLLEGESGEKPRSGQMSSAGTSMLLLHGLQLGVDAGSLLRRGGGVSGNTSKNDSGLILALRVLFLFVPSISFFASAQPYGSRCHRWCRLP